MNPKRFLFSILFLLACFVAYSLYQTPSGQGISLEDGNVAVHRRLTDSAPTPEERVRSVSSALSTRPQTVADRWANEPVCSVEVTPLNAQYRKRVRLVKTSRKYPLVRVEDIETNSQADGTWRTIRQRAMAAEHVLVRRAPGISVSQFEKAIATSGASTVKHQPAGNLSFVKIASETPKDLPDWIAVLSRNPVVDHVDPDWIGYASTLPNDKSFSHQWALHNKAPSRGLVDADIDAPEAWSLHRGSRNVIVAVVDSGVAGSHGDLAANMWQNPKEVPLNQSDEDRNGYVDDVRGWDFYNNDADPKDDAGHGTGVAGIIGAVGNNALGVSGVCWYVSLMPVKWLGRQGDGFISDAISAMAYAADNGASIINNSWGGFGPSEFMQEEFQRGQDLGVLYVCAAGNEGLNLDRTPDYPSCYELDFILSVAATHQRDGLSAYSNFGATQVDIAAPGDSIYAPSLSGYRHLSGTSAAAPLAAGVCALMKSYRPEITASDIKSVLMGSGDSISALEGLTANDKRLNAFQALARLDELAFRPEAASDMTREIGGEWSNRQRGFTIQNFGKTPATWKLTTDVAWLELSAKQGNLAPGARFNLTADLNSLADALPVGTSYATLEVQNLLTGVTQTQRFSVEVLPPLVWRETLDADPSWDRTGEWAFGQPTGQGGGFSDPELGRYLYAGGPDPTSGHTGSNVLGTALNGDYSYPTATSYHVTSPAYDFTGLATVQLRYQRWLNIEGRPWATAGVQVYQPGKGWVSVWSNGEPDITDKTWILTTHNVTAYAAGRSGVRFRWYYHVPKLAAPLNYFTWPFSGWNLDDIEVRGLPKARLYFDAVAAMKEGQRTATKARLRVTPPPTTPLVVTLHTSADSRLSVPASVTIPARGTSVTVPLMPIDNALPDGSSDIAITATAVGWTGLPSKVRIVDNDTTGLTLALPPSLTEGTAFAEATLQLVTPAASPIVFSLKSSLPHRLEVPTQIEIPAGESMTKFTVRAPFFAGSKSQVAVKVAATATGVTPAYGTVTVVPAPLDIRWLLARQTLPEDSGLLDESEVQLILAAPVMEDTRLALASSDSGKAVVPTSVIVKKGFSGVKVPVRIVDNFMQNAPASVTLTAAAGASQATVEFTITDDDPAAFSISPVPMTVSVGEAIPLLVTAVDSSGNVIPAYRGPINLSASVGSETVALGKTGPPSFSAGRWLGSFNIATARSAVVIKAKDGGSAAGFSNPFTVGGDAVRFFPASTSGGPPVYSSFTKRLYYNPTSTSLAEMDPTTGVVRSLPVASNGTVGTLTLSEDQSQLYLPYTNTNPFSVYSLLSVQLSDFSIQENLAMQVTDLCSLPGNPKGVVVKGGQSVAGVYTWGIFVVSPGVAPEPIPSAPGLPPIARMQPGRTPGEVLAFDNSAEGGYSNKGGKIHALQIGPSAVTSTQLVHLSGSYQRASLLKAGDYVCTPHGHIVALPGMHHVGTPKGGSVSFDSISQRFITTDFDGICRVFEKGSLVELGTISTPSPGANLKPAVPCGDGMLAVTTDSGIHLVRTGLLHQSTDADLHLEAVATPSLLMHHEPCSITCELRNEGNVPAEEVSVWLRLPQGSVCTSATAMQGEAEIGQGECRFQLGAVPPGGCVLLRVSLAQTGRHALTYEAFASSSTSEAYIKNNTSSGTIARSQRKVAAQSALPVNDIAYDAESGCLHACVTSPSGPFAYSLLELNPNTLEVELVAPIRLHQPGKLTPAAGSTYLHALVNSKVTTIDLNDGAVIHSVGSDDRLPPADGVRAITALPGSPDQVLVVTSESGQVKSTIALLSGGVWSPDRLDKNAFLSLCRTDRSTDSIFAFGGQEMIELDAGPTGVTEVHSQQGIALGTDSYSPRSMLQMNGRLYVSGRIFDAVSFEKLGWWSWSGAEYSADGLRSDVDAQQDVIYTVSTGGGRGSVSQYAGADGALMKGVSFFTGAKDTSNPGATPDKVAYCGQGRLVWTSSDGQIFSIDLQGLAAPGSESP